jgi:CRISPR-associated protein Cmr6
MNLGLLYYKGMYDDLSDEKLLKLLEKDKKIEINNSQIDKLLKFKINHSPEEIQYDRYKLFNISLKTKSPGLLIGTGYLHEIPNLKGQLINGFEFDYTLGFPKIPASSVKGVLRSAFPLKEDEINLKKLTKDQKFVKQEINQGKYEFIKKILKEIANKDFLFEEIIKIRDEIFNYGDIFLDAELDINNKEIFAIDHFTPHKDKFSNPVPLKFLKVKENITFEFRFLLSQEEMILSIDQRKKLFKSLIKELGIGAKINENYGRFE